LFARWDSYWPFTPNACADGFYDSLEQFIGVEWLLHERNTEAGTSTLRLRIRGKNEYQTVVTTVTRSQNELLTVSTWHVEIHDNSGPPSENQHLERFGDVGSFVSDATARTQAQSQ